MLIFAFDPGETTGFVAVDQGKDATRLPLLVDHKELKLLQAFNNTDLVNWSAADVVAMEEFRVYPAKAQSLINSTLIAARRIGVLEQLCFVNNLTPQVIPASQSKQLWPDTRLSKYFDLHKLTGHERDALRIAMTYLENNNKFVETVNA